MNPESGLNPEQKISRIEQTVQNNPEIAGLQAYEYFRNNGASQKAEFLSGEVDLTLKYPSLTMEAITKIAEPSQLALETLFKGDVSPKSEALFNAIEYRYSELFMLAMARDMLDQGLSDAQRAEARGWFVDANEGLYGKPDKEIFSALAKEYISGELTELPVEFEKSIQLQSELSSRMGVIDTTEFKTFVAGTELLEHISGLVHERFDGVVSHIDEDKTYNADSMVEVLDEALEKLGGKKLGWTTKKVANSSALAVSAHQKQVEVGENRVDSLGAELKHKTIHEVGVHAARAINAERGGWVSAAYGQDGYLDFEEAVAIALEDAYQGKFDDHGENYYLIAGLAYGLDNHEPRNFRETYEVMWRMLVLQAAKGVADVTDEQVVEAQSSAFTSCMRLFRGTDTRQPGVVYLKDLAYFKGQELAWQALKDVHTQEDFDLIFAGKLDLTRSDHRDIAQSIIAANNG